MNGRTVTHIPAREVAPPTAEHPLRVAAYCRVSDPSDEQFSSLENQIQYYTTKLDENAHWKNVGLFSDVGSGRSIAKQSSFKKLLTKCRDGKVDFILTKSISRFGRNSLKAIRSLRMLYSLGVDVLFEQENLHLLDSTAQRVIEIYCALAQNESENISHSIKWGIRNGFQNGSSGYQHFTCYGYRFDEAERCLVIEPNEAEVVRLIFQLRLQGKSYGAIAGGLSKRKILSPTGKTNWNRECIRKMLCNEKYTGSVMLQKTYVEDFFTGKQRKNTGQRVRYLYKNNHPAIITSKIFMKVQK